jgi:hypothetical protein
MRKATQVNKHKVVIREIGLVECEDHVKRVSYSQYLDEKKPCGRKTRLCADNMMMQYLAVKHVGIGAVTSTTDMVCMSTSYSIQEC